MTTNVGLNMTTNVGRNLTMKMRQNMAANVGQNMTRNKQPIVVECLISQKSTKKMKYVQRATPNRKKETLYDFI